MDLKFKSASDDYLKLRKQLLEAEIALRDQRENVAALRRQLPLNGVVEDYVFQTGPTDLNDDGSSRFRDVRLSELFENGKDRLIVIHLMYAPEDEKPCPMCSMWADGYNAIAPHIEQRANFALVTKAGIGKLRAWARGRGWDKIRLLSSYHNTFNQDFFVEDAEGAQYPAVSTFSRETDGKIYHFYTGQASLGDDLHRGIDLFSPVWNLLDLLPEGRGVWYPSHDYM